MANRTLISSAASAIALSVSPFFTIPLSNNRPIARAATFSLQALGSWALIGSSPQAANSDPNSNSHFKRTQYPLVGETLWHQSPNHRRLRRLLSHSLPRRQRHHRPHALQAFSPTKSNPRCEPGLSRNGAKEMRTICPIVLCAERTILRGSIQSRCTRQWQWKGREHFPAVQLCLYCRLFVPTADTRCL